MTNQRAAWSSSSTYAVNSYVIDASTVWKCTTAVTTAGTRPYLDPTH